MPAPECRTTNSQEPSHLSCLHFVPIGCQALDFDGFGEQENKESQKPEGGRVEQPKSASSKEESPLCSSEEEDEIADMEGDGMKEDSMIENQKPTVLEPEQSGFAAEVGDEGGVEVGPNIAYGILPGRLVCPSDVSMFPNAVHQSWLNGQTTLQQAGQCIGAELEVAMLCMQKRLGKVNAIASLVKRRVLDRFSMCRPYIIFSPCDGLRTFDTEYQANPFCWKPNRAMNAALFVFKHFDVGFPQCRL